MQQEASQGHLTCYDTDPRHFRLRPLDQTLYPLWNSPRSLLLQAQGKSCDTHKNSPCNMVPRINCNFLLWWFSKNTAAIWLADFLILKKRAKKEHALIWHGIPTNGFFLIYWHELHLLHRRENIFNIDFMLFSIVFFVHISGHLIKAY